MQIDELPAGEQNQCPDILEQPYFQDFLIYIGTLYDFDWENLYHVDLL